MAFWSKKKGNAKILSYLTNKGISYEIEGENQNKITFSLSFENYNYLLYPYITLEDTFVSVNVNIAQYNVKNYDYEKLNSFNKKSSFFKAYVLEDGVVVLEYRFILEDDVTQTLEAVLGSLYDLIEEIDSL